MTRRVTWRGVTVDERTAAMLEEAARLSGSAYLRPTQGSYSGGVSASAGTHNGGGAVDLAAATLTPTQRQAAVRALRRVGFAAWLRTPSQSDWPWHIHAIAVGCADLAPAARAQVEDYRAGRNGLAGKGPDDGPRDYVGATWETYLAGKPTTTPTPLPQLEAPMLIREKVPPNTTTWLLIPGTPPTLVNLSAADAKSYTGPEVTITDKTTWERLTRATTTAR